MTSPVTARVAGLPRGTARRLVELVAASVPEVAPAISVTVRRRGDLVAEVACGWVEPEASACPMEPGVRFDLASVTKPVTATAVLQLVEQRLVGLDDRLAHLLPELGSPPLRTVDGGQEPLTRVMLSTPARRRWWLIDPSEVTLRQLLSHTSGLAPWRSLFQVTGAMPPVPPAPDPVRREDRRAAALAAIRGYPFVDRPGATIHYSDLGFILLGMVVERLARRPLDRVVAERIAGPLGLRSMGFRPLDAGVPLAAVAPTSFDALWRGRRSHGEPEDENAAGLGGVAGHAGLFATAADVAAFGDAWRTADAHLGIGAALRDAALTEAARGPADRRGLGWRLQLRARSGGAASPLAPLGRRSFGHTGFTGTSLAVDPGRSLVVACLTNRVWHGRANDRFDAFLPRLHALLAEAFPRG